MVALSAIGASQTRLFLEPGDKHFRCGQLHAPTCSRARDVDGDGDDDHHGGGDDVGVVVDDDDVDDDDE